MIVKAESAAVLNTEPEVGSAPLSTVRVRQRKLAPAATNAKFPVDMTSLGDYQTALPRIAKDKILLAQIEAHVTRLPTTQSLHRHDARNLSFIPDNSVHLVVTSPPYWTLKEYRESDGQMGHIDNYAEFVDELSRVWEHCLRVLVPGGRLVCVVGDVCLSRRNNGGEHTVVPLHASIQVVTMVKRMSRLMPMMISGMTMGMNTSVFSARRIGKR